MQTHLDLLRIILGILLLTAIGAGIIRVVRRRRAGRQAADLTATTAQTSALLAYFRAGHTLINAGGNVIDGMRYNMYLTDQRSTPNDDTYVAEPVVIYVLDLPFNTQAHLLGIVPSKSLDQPHFERFLQGYAIAALQTAPTLLGDRVSVYGASGTQLRPEQPSDPAAAGLLAAYGASHLWELHDSELYVVVPDSGIGNSRFIIDSQQFAAHLRSLLPPPATDAPVVHHEVLFDIYDGPALVCPICRKPMQLNDEVWFNCVDGHGVLLSSREFGSLAAGKLRPNLDPRAAVHHGPLACPHCTYALSAKRYAKGTIENCDNCTFCWIDADQIPLITQQ